MDHIVLLGDSIFDNAAYVPEGLPVIAHVRALLAGSAEASLLAVDGSMTNWVPRQVMRLPQTATHLFLSSGGNDALRTRDRIGPGAPWRGNPLEFLTAARADFRKDYRDTLDVLLGTGRHLTVCTIYDAIPGLDEESRTALTVFNDTILAAAIARGLPVIDLRRVCAEAADYSDVSPIEPSGRGGLKIAEAIARVWREHDFGRRVTAVYG